MNASGAVFVARRIPREARRGSAQAGRAVARSCSGLRAEDVEVGAIRPGDLSGQVVLVSPLGSEQYVNVQVG